MLPGVLFNCFAHITQRGGIFILAYSLIGIDKMNQNVITVRIGGFIAALLY